jgi:uncharacterized membrane protein
MQWGQTVIQNTRDEIIHQRSAEPARKQNSVNSDQDIQQNEMHDGRPDKRKTHDLFDL